jgi:hypothetical protein
MVNYGVKQGVAHLFEAIRKQALIDEALEEYREYWEDREEMRHIKALLLEAKRLREENGNFYLH